MDHNSRVVGCGGVVCAGGDPSFRVDAGGHPSHWTASVSSFSRFMSVLVLAVQLPAMILYEGMETSNRTKEEGVTRTMRRRRRELHTSLQIYRDAFSYIIAK